MAPSHRAPGAAESCREGHETPSFGRSTDMSSKVSIASVASITDAVYAFTVWNS